MNAEQAWQTVLTQLQMDMPRASYDTWVRDTRPLACENGVMTVRVRNAYARDWLDSRLAGTVNNLLLNTLDENVSVNFVVAQAEETVASADIETTPAPTEFSAPESKPRHFALNPRYTFDTYVVGSGNRLAHAACQAVAEKPARAYNPLFLYGGVGLGKTHLLHAIGNACHANGLNILYVSSEEFTNDLIAAIRTHTTQAFREKYRSADVLLIDDIQFIAGKESTQEEFFHTFNTLHGQDKQIIVSSDRPPKSLVTLEERLRSRFEWGLTADIQAPDLETRLAILRSKAERTGRLISDEILNGIAQRVQSNIRELEGALNRIIAYADLIGASLTPDLVDAALADLTPSRADLEPAYIVDLVARKFGLTSEKLLGRDRTKDVALPRQIAMYLLREEAKISFPQIGEALGGRDHSTVMSAYDKIKEQMHSDRRLEQDIIAIKQQLYNPNAAM
ncbi:MAG: chromosomal replication initiator protein DnaA [Anaerolineales bacterium]|nr:chromosomal replication initiator protein DnaA [Anaerolineales bacterium]